MRPTTLKQHYFAVGLAFICLSYLGLELFLNHFTMISVDEFWFAHRIYQYKDGLPYRDFAPYKTVLGYYLLLPAMLVTNSIMGTLIFMKNMIALINTGILFAVAWHLTRYFSKSGILAGVSLLVFSEIFLSYSTNLRVDLPAYWFCLIGFLCLLDKRFLLAGILVGLGFCTSQKAIWFIIASNIALATTWLSSRTNPRSLLLALITFNTSALMVIGTYILCWAWLTSMQTVWDSVFNEAKIMYQLDWYDHSRLLFWSLITLFNPLIYLLWPLTAISLMVSDADDTSYHTRLTISAFAYTIMALLIPYKQVFPYYMQVTFPALLLLYTASFSWLFGILTTKQPLQLILGKKYILTFLMAYISGILYSCHLFRLPIAYLLICIIPISLGIVIIRGNNSNTLMSLRSIKATDESTQHIASRSLFTTLLILGFVLIGGVYSPIAFLGKILSLDGTYQKANLQALNNLLQDGGDYVAGIELIYNKTQPIAGMRHLHGPAIDYLYEPSATLRPVMLASLYQDPRATAEVVLNELKHANVKLYVNNYRMMALPPAIKHYLASQYEHYWGSIYLYAPAVSAGTQVIEIKFAGNYLLEAPEKNNILLNNQPYQAGAIIKLEKGNYTSIAANGYRLKLMPPTTNLHLAVQFQTDDWARVIF